MRKGGVGLSILSAIMGVQFTTIRLLWTPWLTEPQVFTVPITEGRFCLNMLALRDEGLIKIFKGAFNGISICDHGDWKGTRY